MLSLLLASGVAFAQPDPLVEAWLALEEHADGPVLVACAGEAAERRVQKALPEGEAWLARVPTQGNPASEMSRALAKEGARCALRVGSADEGFATSAWGDCGEAPVAAEHALAGLPPPPPLPGVYPAPEASRRTWDFRAASGSGSPLVQLGVSAGAGFMAGEWVAGAGIEAQVQAVLMPFRGPVLLGARGSLGGAATEDLEIFWSHSRDVAWSAVEFVAGYRFPVKSGWIAAEAGAGTTASTVQSRTSGLFAEEREWSSTRQGPCVSGRLVLAIDQSPVWAAAGPEVRSVLGADAAMFAMVASTGLAF